MTKFSPELIEEIKGLYLSKQVSLRQLSARFGVDRTTIVRLLKDNGIQIHESRLRRTTEEKRISYEGFLHDVNSGMSVEDSAKRNNIRRVQGEILIKDAQLQLHVCELYREGKNIKEIAKLLSVGTKKIKKALRIAGIDIERRPINK